MTRFDWDRETREARLRRHGGVPVWADPANLSPDDLRRVNLLTLPMHELAAEYARLSRTQREQLESEFRHRFRKLASAARESAKTPDPAVAAVVAARIEAVDSALRARESTTEPSRGVW